ncbi:MAG: ATP-dependent helicase [Limisphaerales bacterium]
MAREYVLQPYRQSVQLQIDYEAELNNAQRAAVTALPGPALVIAGAGSGKTRTLTYRVAYLLEQGVPADRILLLTFTNKAAKEMMGRVTDLIGQDMSELWGGTFHSIGHRVLRRHAETLGFNRSFTIQDREDAKGLVNACIAEAEIDVKATRFPKPDVVGDIGSLALNKQQSVREVIEERYPWFEPLAAQIEDVLTRYTARKQAQGLMDFDDLLVLWLKLLKEHEDVRELYQKRFQFVLVDEYQDTNQLQAELIDLLGERYKNVMVVGDDSQSIYSWRGANYENIIEFPKRYPKAQVYKIETNYRSTPEILQLANAAIAANTRQFAKELAASRGPGEKPVVAVCSAADEQAAFVAQRALELREEGIELNDMAVLYRSHFHALEMQLELTRRNIPFSITSGIRFFEQAHIKDVTSYLKWLANPRDEQAFKRLALMLPGVGGKTAMKLWSQFLAAHADTTPMAKTLQRCAAVPKKAKVPWAQFSATVSQLETEPVAGDAGKMIELIVEAGYDAYVEANYDKAPQRLDDIEQLGVFARQYETLETFLAELTLLTNVEAEQDRAEEDDEKIRLSTIHQAKGLEFKVVFVVMLCDGMFPSNRSLDSLDGEEEERRLFYVAITRAQDELYLSYPMIRTVAGGSSDDMIQQPSRFLNELPGDLVDEWKLSNFDPYRQDPF